MRNSRFGKADDLLAHAAEHDHALFGCHVRHVASNLAARAGTPATGTQSATPYGPRATSFVVG